MPVLASYVADLPEVADMLCIKSGGTAFPCEACWVPLEQLGDLLSRHALRTEVVQQQMCREATASAARSTAVSTHPVPSCLWGFNWASLDWASSSQVMHIDAMHSEDLGVFTYIVGSLYKVLEKKLNASAQGQAASEAL